MKPCGNERFYGKVAARGHAAAGRSMACTGGARMLISGHQKWWHTETLKCCFWDLFEWCGILALVWCNTVTIQWIHNINGGVNTFLYCGPKGYRNASQTTAGWIRNWSKSTWYVQVTFAKSAKSQLGMQLLRFYRFHIKKHSIYHRET